MDWGLGGCQKYIRRYLGGKIDRQEGKPKASRKGRRKVGRKARRKIRQ